MVTSRKLQQEQYDPEQAIHRLSRDDFLDAVGVGVLDVGVVVELVEDCFGFVDVGCFYKVEVFAEFFKRHKVINSN